MKEYVGVAKMIGKVWNDLSAELLFWSRLAWITSKDDDDLTDDVQLAFECHVRLQS